MHPFKRLTIVAALMALVSVGCGSNVPSGASTTELTIGLLAATTGTYVTHGTAMKNGALMAADDINAKGGVTVGSNIYKLKLRYEETQNSADGAVTAAKSLLDDKVNLLVGVSASTEAAALEPVLATKNVALISGGVVYDGPLFHSGKAARLLSPIALEDEVLLKVMKAKATKVAVITSTEHAALMAHTDQFIESLKAAGMTVVASDTFPESKTRDFTSFLTRYKSLGVQGIIARATFTGPLLIAKQLKQLGMGDVFEVTTASNTTPNSIKGLVQPSDIEGIVIVGSLTAASLMAGNAPGVANYVSAYHARYGADAPDTFSVQGHDMVYLMAAAMAKAGSSDPKAVAAALWKLKAGEKYVDQLLTPLRPYSSGTLLSQTVGGMQAPFAVHVWQNGGLQLLGLY